MKNKTQIMADTKRGMTVPPEPSVFVWSASLYIADERKWEYGELQMTPSTLCFYNHATTKSSITTPQKHAKSLLRMIKLDNICEVKKTLSSYLFKCLVVLTSDGGHHWFGSLPGRDGAYNTVLHFWRERLLDTPRTQVAVQSPTGLGTELLSLAQQSTNTLKEAGQALHQQGEQLKQATNVMFDIHNDLDVAEQLTTNLESWFGHWGMSERNLPLEAIELINAQGIPIIHEFPILYHVGGAMFAAGHADHGSSVLTRLHLSPRRGTPPCEQTGHLRLSKEGATILSSDRLPLYHFKTNDISAINVTSPWKLSLVKYCLGEPDIVYKITSAQMVNILHVLHSIASSKLQYESPMGPPVGDPVWPHPEASENGQHVTQNQQQCNSIVERLTANVPSDLEILKTCNLSPRNSPLRIRRQKQLALKKQAKETVNREEVNKLSDLIGEMKAVALDIQGEQDKQMESIDKLTENVDRANDRLREENRRINRLM